MLRQTHEVAGFTVVVKIDLLLAYLCESTWSPGPWPCLGCVSYAKLNFREA